MLPLFYHLMAAILKIIILLFIGCLSLELQIVNMVLKLLCKGDSSHRPLKIFPALKTEIHMGVNRSILQVQAGVEISSSYSFDNFK